MPEKQAAYVTGDALMNSGIRMAIADLGLTLSAFNGSFARQFGRDGDDLIGRGLLEILQPIEQTRFRHRLRQLVSAELALFTERIVATRPAGPMFGGELTAATVLGDERKVSAILVLVRPDDGVRGAEVEIMNDRLLSEVDARILEGLASGYSTARLAASLYLSVSGIEYHLGNLTRRLKVNNRASLVSKAYALGILEPGYWPPRVATAYVRTRNPIAS
jgi:DNA-binding CsgD family transcriptional regulator